MLFELLNSVLLKRKLKKKGVKIGMRFVPSDLVIDRGCLVGKKTHIADNVKIGKFSYLNSNALDVFIESNTIIGDYCSIAPGVIIGMGNHDTRLCTTHPILFDSYYINLLNWETINLKREGLKDKNDFTLIGSDVWIGARANIKRGIKIGNGAVIAAETVVTRDVPDYAIVAGIPAKIIGYRFDEESVDFLKKNEKYCFWNWNEEELKKNFDSLYDLQAYKNVLMKMR